MFTTLAPNALSVRVPFTRQLDLARANGFDALDPPLTHLLSLVRTSSTERINEIFSKHGLRCGGWQLPFNFAGGNTEYSSGLKGLSRIAELADAVGSRWCFYWIYPYSDELTFGDNVAKHIQRLRPIADVLGERNIRLGLEMIGPKHLRDGHRHDFVHSIPEALELFASIDRSNVGLLLDCFHLYTAHGSLAEVRALTASQVVYVQINDAVTGLDVDEQMDKVRHLPGTTGVIDVVGFLKALDAIGYDGPVAVEPFNAELTTAPPGERVRLAAESLHAVFNSAGITSHRP
jgi:sugar phosphate isomerase/epimerase